MTKPTNVRWVPARCPKCGKVLCEVKPGSAVRKVCPWCKQVQIVKIAA